LDHDPTPRVAVERLFEVESITSPIWEPAAGDGAITRILRESGHKVVASDIVENPDFKLDFTADFLKTTEASIGCKAIVSNPPYRHAQEFCEHAIRSAPYVAMLLRLAFVESKRRTALLRVRPSAPGAGFQVAPSPNASSRLGRAEVHQLAMLRVVHLDRAMRAYRTEKDLM
jgi:hypothetical protein